VNKKIEGAGLAICALFVVGALLSAAIPVLSKPNKNPNNGPKPGTDFSGPHYNLNIIGKKHIGDGDGFYDSDRHVIFVPLEGENTRIWMRLKGDNFRVIDGNGLDDNECTFQMPRGKDKNFMVYIVALGKPGDNTDVDYPDNWIYDNDTGKWYYELAMFSVQGHKGKPQWQDVTYVFWLDYYFENKENLIWGGPIWQVPENVWENMWENTGYFWDLKGADRHIQVRFYPV